MASNKEYLHFILEQLSDLEAASPINCPFANDSVSNHFPVFANVEHPYPPGFHEIQIG